MLKKQYLQNQTGPHTITGQEWYNQQASRAVNQALGRVIRHRADFGAVLLCDERFGNAGTLSQLSKWLRGRVKKAASFGEVQGGLARFFKDKPRGEKKLHPGNETSSAHSTSSVHSASSTHSAHSTSSTQSAHSTLSTHSAHSVRPAVSSGMPFGMPQSRTETQMARFKVDDEAFFAVPQGTLTLSRTVASDTATSSAASSIPPAKKFDWFNQPSVKDQTLPTGKRPATAIAAVSTGTTKRPAAMQQQAQTYLDRAKSSLTGEDFRRFMNLLKMYRAGQVSISELVVRFKALLQDGTESSVADELLAGFKAFVPAKHKATFDQAISGRLPEETDGMRDGEDKEDKEDQENCVSREENKHNSNDADVSASWP